MVTAGADTETTPTQIVYDPIYDHKDGDVASCIMFGEHGAARIVTINARRIAQSRPRDL